MNLPLNIDWQQILLHLLNFVVLFAVLYFLLYKPVKKFIAKREEHYADMDKKAKENFEFSEKAKEEYETKLENAQSEINHLKELSHKDIIESNLKLTDQAKKDADKIISDAKKNAELEHDLMINRAKSEITNLVTEAAEKVVAKTTSESYDSFLDAAERNSQNE